MLMKPQSGEPRLALYASWAVLAASFGLSASSWIALARVAGFNDELTIPGAGVTLASAWLMPVAADGYVVVALVLWMAPVPERVAAFARWNTYAAAGVGIVAQSAYHFLSTLSTNQEAWRVGLAAFVGALPPIFAGLAVHMRALLRRESGTSTIAADSGPTPKSTATHAAMDSTEPVHPAAAPAEPGSRPATDSPPAAPARPSSPVELAPIPAPGPADSAPDSTTAAPATPHTVTVPAPTVTPALLATRKPSPRPAGPLAPSPADTSVTERDAAQPPTPDVDPALLAQGTRFAQRYRAEHGEPINAAKLAARLQVNSREAARVLRALESVNPSAVRPAVNGRPVAPGDLSRR
ncbi:hypothetical protein [Catenuloplanes atrovinosus]|uniref:DUF2637 domain-containing protein n=1 Tax=Catenuloplanes atrovinosus TaxID=137266 RepID=A0AAE3YJP6_9ACTN|nr:hypothetical protein [Catenuloplanes atrovinosus]MDR7273609.1 hypothetical protein [Catenuloplanes atrovinosus]